MTDPDEREFLNLCKRLEKVYEELNPAKREILDNYIIMMLSMLNAFLDFNDFNEEKN